MIVEKGVVTRIEGDHLDAELLRAFMARFNDPRAYAVSHIGWGMDEKAQWDFMATSPLGGRGNHRAGFLASAWSSSSVRPSAARR